MDEKIKSREEYMLHKDNTEIKKLLSSIRDIIHKDNGCDTFFNFSIYMPRYGNLEKQLTIHTFNPEHKATFLLYQSREQMDNQLDQIYQNDQNDQNDIKTRIKLLTNALEWLSKIRNNNFKYKVIWSRADKPNCRYTSWFISDSVQDIMKKFYTCNGAILEPKENKDIDFKIHLIQELIH